MAPSASWSPGGIRDESCRVLPPSCRSRRYIQMRGAWIDVVQRSKFYADYAPIIFLVLIFICLVARIVIAWRSPRHRRVLPAAAAEDEVQDVAALRRARHAADRRAAEAEAARLAAEALRDETAVRLAAEALREETAVRRDVIEALHRRVEELERELAMRAVQEV